MKEVKEGIEEDNLMSKEGKEEKDWKAGEEKEETETTTTADVNIGYKLSGKYYDVERRERSERF